MMQAHNKWRAPARSWLRQFVMHSHNKVAP
jgi:hypothetical protein